MVDVKYYKYDVNNKSKKQFFSDSKLKQAMKLQTEIFPTDLYQIIDFCKSMYGEKNCELFLAEDAILKKVIGYCFVKFPPKLNDCKDELDFQDAFNEFLYENNELGYPYVASLCVAEQYRNLSIGKNLFTMALESIKQKYDHSCLHVNASNEKALKMYKNEGFLIESMFHTCNQDVYLMVKFNNDEIKPISELYYNMLNKVFENEPVNNILREFEKLKQDDKFSDKQEIINIVKTSVLDYKKIKLLNKDFNYSVINYIDSLDNLNKIPDTYKPMLKTKSVYRKASIKTKQFFDDMACYVLTKNCEKDVLNKQSNKNRIPFEVEVVLNKE